MKRNDGYMLFFVKDATKPVDAKSRQDGKYSNRQSAQTSTI